MSTTLSVAVSKDGYMDDMTSERLVLSSAEDWAEVYALRAAADAIVIGAETLRRDNPRLSLKSDELRIARTEEGRTPEPHKVIISGSGYISPSLRIFESPYKNIILFSLTPREELSELCEVVVVERISAAAVVSALEARGLTNIFVEGGAKVLSMFLGEGIADTLRIATNPAIVVDDPAAPHFDEPSMLQSLTPRQYVLGGVEIRKYQLREGISEEDLRLMERAIEISRNCTPSATSYCVGAVIRTASGDIFEGYTHQTSPTHHAEQEAIKAAEAAGANLVGATMYSSMEPCSTRSSEPESCSAIIIRHRFSRALFALYEPSCFVCCKGALNMRHAGIRVDVVASMGDMVREVNKHLKF